MPIFHVHNLFRLRRSSRPYLFLFILMLLICLPGILFIYESRSSATPQKARTFHITPTITAIPTPTPVPTPTPTPFMPQPSPAPVANLPTTLKQQVNTLTAYDRLFYHGNYALPEIALTFDDGPNPPYTQQILDVLRNHNVKATFFDLGEHVAEHPELVLQEVADGHLVANHTWSHPHLPTISQDAMRTEINNTSDILQKVTGTRPTYFRPPYGEYDQNVLPVLNQLGMTTFLWDNMASDWTLPGASVISQRIIGGAHNGMIILLHDGGGDRSQTAAALPTIIERLQARGYRFVTLNQMVANAHARAQVALPSANSAQTLRLKNDPQCFTWNVISSVVDSRRRAVERYRHI